MTCKAGMIKNQNLQAAAFSHQSMIIGDIISLQIGQLRQDRALMN